MIRKLILILTLTMTLAGTLLVPAQSVRASSPDAPLLDLVTTNDNNSLVTYSGTWTYNTPQTDRLFEDDHTSSTTSDYSQLTFTGSTVSLIVTTGPDQGEAEIYIDTVLQETVDLYTAGEVTQHIIYAKNGLTVAAHTIKVVVKGTKNASSSGYTVNIDAFRFTDAANAPPPGAAEIECRTQAGAYFVCSQTTTQKITIIATEADAHFHPRWKLNASGIGVVYVRMSGISVHVTTNAFSNSGTLTMTFDPIFGGSGAQTVTVGPYGPNQNKYLAVGELTGQNTAGAAGNYETNDNINKPLGFIGATYNTYVMEIQTVPFASDCAEQYTPLQTFGPLVIDPTAEFPAAGEDEQVVGVTGGSTVMVRVGGDGWHDGSATDLWDAQYYIPTAENPEGEILDIANAQCLVQTEGYYKFTAIIEIPAGGEWLHMRAKDAPGDFGDNYSDANEHFIFTISEVTLTGALSCEQQFTYDSFEDLVAFEEVPADEPYVDAIEPDEGEGPIVNGEWYVIQVWDGDWQDDGDPPDRFDAQFSWGNVLTGEPDGVWRTLGTGGTNVYCVTYDADYATIYVQAEGGAGIEPRLYFRVNDSALTWTENTGSLFINVYSATFERVPVTCETTYGVHGFIGTSEIPANAENGVIIGVSTSLTTASFGNIRLQPGGWYMLETAAGPWGWVGSLHSELSYLVEVQWGGEWVALADWSEAICNVETDGVGHRRLFFQTPSTGSAEYKFRVADTATWFNNVGRMNIDLYGAYDMAVSLDDGSCDYDHEEFPFVTKNVNANDADGDGLGVPLSPSGLYAVQLDGNPSWSESSGGGALYGMQISVDGGGTWQDLPSEYGGVLCYYNDGTDLWFFMRGVDIGEFTSVRFRVDSETFSNNTGGMTVNVFGATEGSYVDPDASCLDELGIYVLDDYIPIDVRAEEGQDIPIQPAWLESQNTIGFLVKIDWNGSNYWTDGETELQHRDAALSPDNGVTWGPLDPTNTAIICATKDEIGYASAYFQIADEDIWKIRVNDIDTETFADNGGQLAYRLYGVTTGGPVDCVVEFDNPDCIDWSQIPSGILINGVDICLAAIIQPVAPTTIDVPAWLQYVAGWVVYAGEMIMAYGAWCPRHQDMLASILDMFRGREPFATLTALRELLLIIQTNLQAYNWEDTSAETSGLESAAGGGDAAADDIVDRILPAVTGPWAGGPVIQLASWTGSIPYSDCLNEFGEFIPNDGLVTGLCFVSANAREAGLFFFLQLLLDFSILVLAFVAIRASFAQLAETMAGGPVTSSSGGDSADD
jgi:hypothetical protein